MLERMTRPETNKTVTLNTNTHTKKTQQNSNAGCGVSTPLKTFHHRTGGTFHIRQQFHHELSCNYKLCGAQLKVEDVRVSEQTSTAVCQRASRGGGRGVK